MRQFLLLLLLALPALAQRKALRTPFESAEAAQPTTVEPESRLPVKRIVLYKNGVGYFEHTGRVHGTQDLSIEFTTAQLNDVLKSLTAVDLGDGHVSSVRYNSIAPLGERLKTLRMPLGEQVTQAEYITALRGARVEVHSGSAVATGRLLSVEQIRRQRGKGNFEDVTSFSIITDAGEMRSFDLGTGTSVRIAERELTDEVERYLSLVGSSRARDVRRMSFTAVGSGDRDIFVSYISEVPIWKSTYRILLPEKPGNNPLLQGWAIVDNTIGEDWKDVQLSLVAGAPQSFIQDISQPFYARRPVIPLPQSVILTPQTQEATVQEFDRLEQTAKLQAQRTGSPEIAGTITEKEVKSLNLNGRNFSQLVAIAPGVSSQTGQDQARVAMARQAAEAEGKSTGDFFEYAIKQKVSLAKNQSALVPILQANVEAEKVTLWNSDSVPVRALWIKNTSGQVLDSGSFNVLDAHTFAGEGVLETIHPGERRLLSYAGDAPVHVKFLDESSATPYSHIVIAKGIMVLTKEQRATRKYTIRNADTESRQVIVESPAQDGWKLAPGTPQPEESSASYYRFRVPVEAGKTAELTVATIHSEQEAYGLTDLDDEKIVALTDQKRITPAMQQAFGRILKQKQIIEDLASQIAERKGESDQIAKDQNRIRENMKALKGSSDEKALIQRYVGQLDLQENRLAVLRKETTDLTAQEHAGKVDLDRMILEVSLDVSF